MPTVKKKPSHHSYDNTSQTKENPQPNQQATDEILAKSWAIQYGEMHGEQKLIARKLISDILFHGCLGNLEMSHAMRIQDILMNEPVTHYHQPMYMDLHEARKHSSPNADYLHEEDINEICSLSSEN